MIAPKMRYAWAIATERPTQEKTSLIGTGWFGWFNATLNPSCQSGNCWTPAIFRTRNQAREHLPLVKGPKDRGCYPNARVVKVQIQVDVV